MNSTSYIFRKAVGVACLAAISLTFQIHPAVGQEHQDRDIEQLLADLKHEQSLKRMEAMRELSKLGKKAEPAVPVLIEMLDSEDKALVSSAATVLGIIGAKEAIPKLITMLQDGSRDRRVRCAAASALGRFGSDAADAIPHLMKMLAEDAIDIRQAAAMGLGGIGLNAMPTLVSALESDDEEVAGGAAIALGSIGPKAVAPLIKTLSDKRPAVRAAAAKGLGQIGPDAKAAVPHLTRMLNDEAVYGPQIRVGSTAGLALGKIRPDTPDAIQGLIAAAGHGDFNAIRALGEIGPEAKMAVPVLIGLLENSTIKFGERTQAIKTLGAIGVDAETAIPVLVAEIGKSRSCRYASEIVRSLTKMGPKAIPAIIDLIKDEKSSCSNEIIRTLGHRWPGAEDVLPSLTDLALKGNRAAADAVVAIGPKSYDRIIDALSDRASCRQAADILTGLGVAAIDPLVTALKHDNSLTQAWACHVLARLGPDAESTVPLLLEVFFNSQDSQVSRASSQAIFAIGVSAAIPGLVKAVEDEDAARRRAAISILGAIARKVPAQSYDTTPESPRIPGRTATQPRISQSDIRAAFDGLLLALHDADSQIRLELSGYLKEPKAETDYVLTRLIAILEDPNPDARAAGLFVIGKMGSDAKVAVPAIIRVLRAANPKTDRAVHRAAVRALSEMGPDAKEAVPLLIEQLRQEPDASYILGALSKMGPPGIPPLVDAIKDDREEVRERAKNLLRGMRAESKAVIPALIKIIDEGDSTMRLRAIFALSEIVSEAKDAAREAIPALTRALEDSDENVRKNASIQLRRLEK